MPGDSRPSAPRALTTATTAPARRWGITRPVEHAERGGVWRGARSARVPGTPRGPRMVDGGDGGPAAGAGQQIDELAPARRMGEDEMVHHLVNAPLARQRPAGRSPARTARAAPPGVEAAATRPRISASAAARRPCHADTPHPTSPSARSSLPPGGIRPQTRCRAAPPRPAAGLAVEVCCRKARRGARAPRRRRRRGRSGTRRWPLRPRSCGDERRCARTPRVERGQRPVVQALAPELDDTVQLASRAATVSRRAPGAQAPRAPRAPRASAATRRSVGGHAQRGGGEMARCPRIVVRMPWLRPARRPALHGSRRSRRGPGSGWWRARSARAEGRPRRPWGSYPRVYVIFIGRSTS